MAGTKYGIQDEHFDMIIVTYCDVWSVVLFVVVYHHNGKNL